MSDTSGAAPADASVARQPLSFLTLPRFAIILAVLLLASFPDVILGWRSFFTRDFANFGYPLAWHVQQSYCAGEIPLWDPYNFAGIPFLAQWNTLALYPPSLIYILLPLPWSLNCFNLLHLYLGGLSMFCLARRWLRDGRAAGVAGVAYAYSGLLVSSLMWPNNVAALGWLPCVLLTGERAACDAGKSRATASLVIALQFLSGAPEIIGLTWAGLLAVVLFAQETPTIAVWRRFGRLAPVFLACLGLGAMQLLPFVELLQHSQRSAAFASGDWTLSWDGLGNFLVPLFHTVQNRDGIFFQPSQQWVSSYYPGSIIALLSMMALVSERTRRVRWLTLFCLLSLALALGTHGFVYDWLRRTVPGLGLMRYPIKFIVPCAVILPLLAGFGVRAWLHGKINYSALLSLGGGVALLSLALMAFSQWRPMPGEQANATWRSGLTALTCLIVSCAVMAWLRRTASRDLKWLLPTVLIMVVFGDLFLANEHVNPVVRSELLTGNVAVLEPRPALERGRAMVTHSAQTRLDDFIFTAPEAAVHIPRQALVLNDNLLEGVPKLDGFFSLYLPRVAAIVARLSRQTNSPADDGLLDFLGVSHLNRPDKPWEWDPRTNALPLVALVPRGVFLDATNTLNALFSAEFNPRTQVFLPLEAAGQLQVSGAGRGQILSSRVGAHRIEVTVKTDQPMMLTLAQANYPGWRATVDDQPVPLWTANYAFQALQVPAGEHQVRLAFRSSSFHIGAFLTVISLLTLVGVAIADRRAESRCGILTPPLERRPPVRRVLDSAP